ncbi:MAG TPA: hypothetical protein VG389_20530 [Myxococcota bacterium]|nr:hypothetical protein [Myxococcota bacterium]
MRPRSILLFVFVSVAAVVSAPLGCRGGGDVATCDSAQCDPGQECSDLTHRCEDVACTPGATRCAPRGDGSLERCNSTGDGYVPVGACGAGQTCFMSATSPSGAACDPPACTAGTSQCEADGSVRYCVVGAFESSTPCPSGEACDPSQSSACVPTECGPGTTFCEPGADVVRACNALGTSSGVVETCAASDVCNAGRCVSLCELAELQHSTVGCVFMALDTNNTAHDDPLQYDVVIANPNGALTATVTIETRTGPGGAWSTVATDAVTPSSVHVFALPDRHAEGSSLTPALAYRVTASVPVVAYQFNSDDVSGSAASSGATILLPVPALDRYYYAVSLPMSTGDDALFPFGGELHSSGVAVVGTLDGTTVTVTASTNTAAGGGIAALAPGESYSTVLNEGDALQIEAADVGDDVTGTYVTSDQPVAVFGYHECAVLTPGTCDHVEEQLLPLTAWGIAFANVRMFAGTERHLWRLLASEDATTITFEYDAGVTGLPAPAGASVVLDAGQHQDFTVEGPAPVGLTPEPGNVGDFYAYADKPIYVVQFSMDEVNMVTSVPTDQTLPQYVFAVPPFLDSAVTVARPSGATTSLDGVPIPAASWSSAGGTFEAYRTALADGAHVVSSTSPSEMWAGSPGVYVSGEASNCGYAYVAGLNVEYINPFE